MPACSLLQCLPPLSLSPAIYNGLKCSQHSPLCGLSQLLRKRKKSCNQCKIVNKVQLKEAHLERAKWSGAECTCPLLSPLSHCDDCCATRRRRCRQRGPRLDVALQNLVLVCYKHLLQCPPVPAGCCYSERDASKGAALSFSFVSHFARQSLLVVSFGNLSA